MPHRKLNVAAQGMLDAYKNLLDARGYIADAAQLTAASALQDLYTNLLSFKVNRSSTFKRLLTPPKPPKGVYFWGGVGRGKSFLMDCFYDSVPYRRKRRIHFHAFMQQIHRDLEQYKGEADPVVKVAEQIAREVRLLCFDEFHVSDIADAMILGRLMEGLFAKGVILVMTSNYPPDRLYPNGLHRESFLPTIALLNTHLDVFEVEAGVDYRLRALEQVEIFHYPADAAAEKKMFEYFRMVAGEDGKKGGQVEILGRNVETLRRGHGVIWFDFRTLCGGPRSQNDYLEIARAYHTVLLSHIPRMTQHQASEARRFTWLVDVFYDHKVKLIATADCAPEALYTEGTQASEFARTVSRLTEMHSKEYLALPHLTTA
ncbi:cell division protein ZapE [Dechloromonas denitrificans]|uniref:cell division protein ZapE n=1 Tax=Dechloromonas denitrificans TaxID=281362 RepID=UPI001CF8DFD9|nr:cell division protein ZapE [Dechloromonas denitrificans]UCV04887.1 AFG1 family ATPase [Dechloromonas denitrificans]UCV09269.1 AFG1 family ATPase [Dechloromonas denitrificans]